MESIEYLTKVKEKLENLSDEDFLKLFEKEIQEKKEWDEKYTWNMNEQRFVNKLNSIINKIFDIEENDCIYGYYSVASDENNEDFNYLVSLENYLTEHAKKYNIPIDFYEDEFNTFAESTIPFKYNNKLYILEHGFGQGSYIKISYIEDEETMNPNNIINIMEEL